MQKQFCRNINRTTIEEDKQMNIRGTKDGKKYTISLEGDKLATILVESLTSYQRELYQRGPVQYGLTIDHKIFEEALLAVCQKNLQMWANTYEVLRLDEDYGQKQILEIFKKHFK